MQDQQSRRQLPVGIIAGLSALVLATGSAAAWWGWHSIVRPSATPDATQRTQPPRDESKAPGVASAPTAVQKSPVPAGTAQAKTLQIYWLNASSSKIALAPSSVTVSASNTPTAILTAGMNELLRGPTNQTATTTIPHGTVLRRLTVKDDGIHVDLSQAFTRGGGSTAMIGRIGQVLYTATSLDPSAKVWLSVEGKPLETLGGEGLILDQPMTRSDFNQNFSL